MSKHIQDEAELRNKANKGGDSLMEQKKLQNGVDIEPEADDWIAKPAESAHPDPLPKNQR